MGFQRKLCGCDCPSQMRKIRFSNFKTPETIENFTNFICQAIKHYKELWCVEDRAWSGRPRYVRTKAAMKTVQEWIRQNPLWKQNSLSQELNNALIDVTPHQVCSTHERLLAVKGTPRYSHFSGTPRTGTKTFSSRMRKSSPLRSSTTARKTRFMLKHSVR